MVRAKCSKSSKAVWACFNVVILMATGALIYRLVAGSLIGLTAFAPQAGDSTGTIPSVMRTTVEFNDRGRLYRVDTETGQVAYTDTEAVKPDPPTVEPEPKPGPEPEPPPINEVIDDFEYEHKLTLKLLGTFNGAVSKADRVRVAELIAFACTATLAQTGGLDLTYDEARTALADVIRLTIKPPIKGFDLLGIYDAFGVDDRDSLIRAMQITEKAFGGVK
jgi:uncharacterized membrane protein